MKFFRSINNFFKTIAYDQNTVIMLIGSENTVLTAYSAKGFSLTTNIPNTDSEFFGKYRSFLNQFKGWDVILLLDNENIKIESGELPILQSMIKTKDHAKDFVLSSVDHNAIVAYSKRKGQTDAGVHIENITFAHTQPSAQLLDIISFIYNFNFPLVGIYILAMEIHAIIKDIISNIDLSSEDKFIIFVVPTLVSGIRIFILDRGIIYASKTAPYPHGKSPEYVAGLIEQLVSDILTKHKKYIVTHKLSVEIFSLTSIKCAHIIAKQDIDTVWHPLSWEASKQKMTFADFGDEVLIHNLQLKHSATNKDLRQVNAMEKFNYRGLNLVIALLIGIVLYAGFIEYKVLHAENNLDTFSAEYYKISESYREARKKLHNVNNLSDIYDIISDIAILKAPMPAPIDITKHIVDLKDKRAHISQISWKLTKENIGEVESELLMNMHYEDKSNGITLLEKHLNEYQISLTRLFPNYKIDFTKDKNGIMNLPTKVMIPVKFTIIGPIEDK
jgi:hypothetical protein